MNDQLKIIEEPSTEVKYKPDFKIRTHSETGSHVYYDGFSKVLVIVAGKKILISGTGEVTVTEDS